MICVYIGPNGYGKTTKLHDEKKKLVGSGIKENEILFLESEILLMDEVKDTKDESKTMEFILQELLMTSTSFSTAKSNFEKQISVEIRNNKAKMNSILSDILSLNGNVATPGVDFIDDNPKMAFKNLVKIDTNELKKKTGSGQRMQLILSLVAKSTTKKYIFLDEPEKYSHPSLLNRTAKLIKQLDLSGKTVYIATHSPKLISMLDIPFSNITIINDSSHNEKQVDFNRAVSSVSFSCINSMKKKEKSFYDAKLLEDNIKNSFYREFIECLFTSKIYLCEGINDKHFVLKALKDEGKYFDDYCVFVTYGKFTMPVFEKLFSNLGIVTEVFFDEDTNLRNESLIHQEIDDYLEKLNGYEFKPNIEDELGYGGEKYNVLDFIEHLDNLSLIKGKYLK